MRTHHELIFLALGVVLAALVGWRRFALVTRPFELATHWLARSNARACLTCMVACAGLSVLTGLWDGIHYPGTHDEYGYLLQGDTFAQGRLSNRPHPFWRHFESMHIITQPTYQAKYPPGQGIAIAVGQLLTGIPMAGIWISACLSAAAIWWMLAGFLPPRWALVGGLLWVCKLAPSPWAQSFWGGAVACTGGALLLGGLRRTWDKPTWSASVAMGAGVAILANTRPYEGLVLTLVVAGTLLVRLVQVRWSPSVVAMRLVLPAALALAPAIGWMAAYNHAVTGHWTKMPYSAHDATYAANPTFLFQSAWPAERIPTYNHEPMREYYVDWERHRWEQRSQWFGLNGCLATKLWGFFRFFVGGPYLVPLIALACSPGRPWLRFAAVTVLVAIVANSQTLYLYAHYTAGITGLTLLLGIEGMRRLQTWTPYTLPVGRVLSGLSVACLAAGAITPPLSTLITPLEKNTPRSRFEKLVRDSRPGRHLLFVKYLPGHNIHDEWVYNGAEIDACEFVWARHVSPESDAALAAYYPDRTIWELKISETSFAGVPIREPEQTGARPSPPLKQRLFPFAPFERAHPAAAPSEGIESEPSAAPSTPLSPLAFGHQNQTSR